MTWGEGPTEAQEPGELIGVRMINEVAYCARLFALEHLFGEWADSADTVDGRRVHRRVDQKATVGMDDPEAQEKDPDRPKVVRSVTLGDPGLGIIAKMDLVEQRGQEVVPVDYKRGHPPDVPEGAWEPERVQLCAQGLLLRAHGYTCDRGVLYFAGGRRRVGVVFTEELVAATLAYIKRAHELMADGSLPPPLQDSPKCWRCSLAGICLPDEHHLLKGHQEEVRPLMPPRDDAVPLVVQLRGGVLRKRGGEILVEQKGVNVGRARLTDTSRVAVYGNVTLTTPLLHELAQRDIPVSWHSYGGWFQGSFHPVSGKNVQTRIAQHAAARDEEAALRIAREMVATKLANSRVMLRRNARQLPRRVLDHMADGVEQARKAPTMGVLRGVEGYGARQYYQSFPRMLRGELMESFAFEGRNRRPPRDPINAMLSFAYSMLVREISTICVSIGLDAWVGFLHTPRAGRASLALDLMEEFRPVIADSAVINAVNNEVLRRRDFVIHPTGVMMSSGGKKRFVQVVERRLDELVTHPVFGSRLSYRRVLEVQARLLGKVVLGELDTYPGFRIR